jgi:integrase
MSLPEKKTASPSGAVQGSAAPACAIFQNESTFAEPFNGERMARRQHQNPNVQKSKGANPYWYIRYRRNVLVGKDEIRRREVKHHLGFCGELTKRQAQKLRDEIMRGINGQVYTIQSQIGFKDLAEVYKQRHLVTLAVGGRKRDLSLIDTHIIPALGERRLCDIGTEEVQAFLNEKLNQGLSWWTRKALKAVISSIFSKASDWGYWNGHNPTSRTSIGKKKRKREKRILSDDQFQILMCAVPADIRLMMATAVTTGMRVSEILGLKWKHLDLERGIVRVEERYYRGDTDEPKTEGSRRVLPLGQLTATLKNNRPISWEADQYVFARDGEPMDDRAILRNVIRPAAKRLGIYFEGLGWHSFRRQNLTLMQEEGATTFEAMAQAGHTRPAMTSEYTVVDLGRRTDAVIRLQERLNVSALVN